MANIPDIINNVKAHLRDIAGDVVGILKKDNEKIISKLDELKPKEPVKPKDYTGELKAIESAVKNQKEVESISINNPEAITGDLKEGLQGIIEALQTELKNFDKNIVVKNDFSNFASLFKSSQDKKSVIEALKKIENKLDKEETDYTMILSDIAKAVEDKEAISVLKDLLAKEYNVQFPEIMAVDLDPNLIEDSRVKVKMSDKQVKAMSAVGTSNSRPIVEKIDESNDILDDLKTQGDWLQQLGIDKDDPINYYFGFKLIDVEEWRIKRINKTTFAVDWATGTSDSDTAWTNRTTQSYGNL